MIKPFERQGDSIKQGVNNIMFDNSKLTFREANEDDISSCCNAFYFLLEETKDLLNQDLTFSEYNVKLFKVILWESIRTYNICPIIAEYQGLKVGWCLLVKTHGFNVKYDSAQAMGSYVEKEFRGNGIATMMLEKAFEILRNKNIKKIFGKFVGEKEANSNLQLNDFIIKCKTL